MGKLNVGESENVTTSVKNVRKSRAGGLSRISRTKSASRVSILSGSNNILTGIF